MSEQGNGGNGSARITNREIYDALQQLRGDFIAFRAEIRGTVEDQGKDIDDHEKRIRRLDTKFYAILGGISLSAAALVSRVMGT